jgi:hypothetical protein
MLEGHPWRSRSNYRGKWHHAARLKRSPAFDLRHDHKDGDAFHQNGEIRATARQTLTRPALGRRSRRLRQADERHHYLKTHRRRLACRVQVREITTLPRAARSPMSWPRSAKCAKSHPLCLLLVICLLCRTISVVSCDPAPYLIPACPAAHLRSNMKSTQARSHARTRGCRLFPVPCRPSGEPTDAKISARSRPLLCNCDAKVLGRSENHDDLYRRFGVRRRHRSRSAPRFSLS